MRTRKRLSIAITLDASNAPPSEFRIFRKGVNASEQGPVLFDAVAARAVMANYATHGVAPIIDLEHLSLEDPKTSVNYDPDARGSFQLEMRDGDLWAVNVHWTEDAVARLTSKRQRYFSPAFIAEHDPKSTGPDRIVQVINVALCAQPALDHLPPLVAANRRTPSRAVHTFTSAGASMTPEQVAAIAEAFGLDASASLADVVQAAAAFVKEMQDAANGASPPPATGGDSPLGSDDAGTGDAAAMRMTIARTLVEKMGLALNKAPKGHTDKALVAFRSSVLRVTDATTTEEATDVISRWRQSHVSLAREMKKVADDRAELEAVDRIGRGKELVALRVFTPAQVWAGDKDGIPEVGKPSALLLRFTLLELKSLVEVSKKSGRSTNIADDLDVDPPAENHTAVEVVTFTGAKQVVELSEAEVTRARESFVKKFKLSPTDAQLKDSLVRYATMKANSDLKAGKKAG